MPVIKEGNLVRARKTFTTKVMNMTTGKYTVYTVHQYAVLKVVKVYPGGNYLVRVTTDLIYQSFKVKGSLLIKNDKTTDLLYGLKDI